MNYREACKEIKVHEGTARVIGARDKFFKKVGKEVICIDFIGFKEFILNYKNRMTEQKQSFWNEQEIECIKCHKLGSCKFCSVNFIKDCKMAKHIIAKIGRGAQINELL